MLVTLPKRPAKKHKKANPIAEQEQKVNEEEFFKPEELNRDVLTIRFNQYNKVAEFERLNKEQGQTVTLNETQTETQGSQAGFFEKYFGGVGQFLPFGKASSTEVNK